MELVETHAHIYLDQFKDDLDEVIDRSRQQGVDKIYLPNINVASIDAMLELEHRYPGYCIPMMGLHPCSVDKNFEKELYVIEDWLNQRDFVAIGEIGTDLYWDKSFYEQQKEAFIIQSKWAIDKDRPIVIHCRESIDETIELVKGLKEEKLRGIFHCFSGTVDQANQIIEMDFLLGIGGVATFKNGGIGPVLEAIDLKHLVLETDSPYLTPTPHRGKRNEPAYLDLVAQKIAETKKTTKNDVAKATTENANRIFN